MQTSKSKRRPRLWAWGFMVLWAFLAWVPWEGSALAAPTETVLHNFTGGNGAYPIAGLTADSQGNLYGTAVGDCTGDARIAGIVFKLAPDGTNYMVLHNFTSGDGLCPWAGLIADSQGNLYGTTEEAGALGYGTVFKLAPDGTNYTVLHNFTGGDGVYPTAGLIADSQGNLYGATGFGGASGYGTVFKLAPDGTNYTVLHNFTGGDGANPYAGLIADSQGNLYGTATGGGTSNAGVVFKLAPDKTNYTVLHNFTGGDGANLYAGLIADSQGNLYGTTHGGGAGYYGVVFKLTDTGFAILLDNFNHPNGKLGINWSGSAGPNNYKIVNNQVTVWLGGPIYWNPTSFGINQEALVTLNTVNPNGFEQGLVLKTQRRDGAGTINYQRGVINVDYRAQNNAVLVSTYQPNRGWKIYPEFPSITFTNGDKLSARVYGDGPNAGTVHVYKNGAEIGVVTLNDADKTFFNPRGGYIGLWFISSQDSYFDDFGGGNL